MSIFYWVIIIGSSLIGFIVSSTLKSKFAKYSKVAISGNFSGAEIADKMLSYYGINDVKIVIGQGMLSDHYNPATKTVNLSPDVFKGRSIASAAVAAHECGHAVQHKQAYSWLTMRSAMVPVVQIASTLQQFLLIGAFVISGGLNMNPIFLLIITLVFGITALFSVITLPVEFDASKRALAWLTNSNTVVGREYEGAKDALKWAAMTYLVAALSALVMFLYWFMRMNSRN
jgi:uncharacterized protein